MKNLPQRANRKTEKKTKKQKNKPKEKKRGLRARAEIDSARVRARESTPDRAARGSALNHC